MTIELHAGTILIQSETSLLVVSGSQEVLDALRRLLAVLRPSTPRWSVDPDDPRRIIHADSLPDCGKTLTECLQEMEANRLHDVAADFEDWHEGYEDALDRLREILHDHGIPVSPTSDGQPDPLDETDHRDRWDRDQSRWVRCVSGRWHFPTALECTRRPGEPHCWGWSLRHVSDEWGPLTFAPEEDS